MSILGIDVGTSSTKGVLLDGALAILDFREWKNKGNPLETLENAWSYFLEPTRDTLYRIGITGAGRDLVQVPPGFHVVNEVIALASGVASFFPGTRSIIEIGAQTSRWVLLSADGSPDSEPDILDFALNEVCATGSGSFLEQQASRLKLPIEDFGKLAAAAGKGANIAGRCSVFAKTDMIHLQQKGTPLEEIAYGLCLALARNFSATVLKGREAVLPVLLAGGAARNPGLVKAIREILQSGEQGLRVADPPQFLCALGAASGALKNARDLAAADFRIMFRPQESRRITRSLPLGPLETVRPVEPFPLPGEPVTGTLGVDIGSVSTNLVVVDDLGTVKAGVYLPTKGRPLEVLREGYRLLRGMCRGGLVLNGIGTTGSGRHLAAASSSPCDLSSRCTVFMESELADALGRGVPVPDITAGLAHSIARNYLEKVVAGRPVGKSVVFQGGVASNPAVVRAFALELEREILVHPHNRISGAIGAALLAGDLGMRGLKLLWQGLVAIDLLVRASCAIRPYETRKGTTDEAHVQNLADIESGLSAGDIGPALKRCAERLKAVEKKREKRPIVGIAGDVYTRINPVANHGLFLKLEELGCEVRPSSFIVDDVDFGLGRELRRKLASRRYGKSSITALLYLRKELEKVKIRMSLEGTAPLLRDPTYNDVLRLSSPYLGLEANNVLLLNIAKMAEFAGKGADGVINAICFNCMLGTVSAAIAGRIRKDYDGIPIPTFIYTGSELSSEKTKLEAFVYQVKQSAARGGRRKRQERKKRRITLPLSKPSADKDEEK